MGIILKAENISKQYRLGLVGTGTLSHDLNRWWHSVRGKEDPYLQVGAVNDRSAVANQDYVWALRDINFEVQEGEVLGIIGKNGAGKSTLLKILSRVTSPTTGEIKTRGRIASLLEVGTGFHPELTGRENIFLNGAILGMTKPEIKSKIDEIIAFSGCEMYIDTPVKRYSSGMRVRLAFAVAAHLEPDILVIDEVLAVGDAEFQKKAIGKMQDISRGEGRTVLFVSHNMAAVKQLCTRAFLIENGNIINEGSSEYIVDKYLQRETESNQHVKKWDNDSLDIPIGENVKMLAAELYSDSDFSISGVTDINFKFELLEDFELFNLSLVISSFDGVPIFNSISKVLSIKRGVHQTKVSIPENLLNNNIYNVRILLVNNSKPLLDIPNILSWEAKEVEIRNMNWFGKISGHVRPQLKWEIN